MILARSRMDEASVISGLLHDVVEDTPVCFEEIDKLFGPTVRAIVEGETKVSKLPKMVRSEIETSMTDVDYANSLRSKAPEKDAPAPPVDKADEQAENLRSMFVAMAEDWRIVVVKLADRLHNMRTLEHMPPAKRVSIARETLEIFAPLAHRLGMWQVGLASSRHTPHTPPRRARHAVRAPPTRPTRPMRPTRVFSPSRRASPTAVQDGALGPELQVPLSGGARGD